MKRVLARVWRLCSGVFEQGAELLVLAMCFLLTEGAAAQTIRGQVTVETVRLPGVFRASYVVLSREETWQIQVDYGEAYSEVCGFDGQDCYSLLHFDPGKHPLVQENGQPAHIVKGSYPFTSEPITRFLWLAFVAGTNLVSDGVHLPALWNSPFDDPQSHLLVISNLDWLNASAPAPARLDFVQSASAVRSLRENPLLSASVSTEEIQAAVRRIKSGFVEAEYRVLERTNWQGRIYPVRFSLSVFSPGRGTRETVQIYVGTVEGMEEASSTDVLPMITERVGVTDYRFSDKLARIDNITYALADETWPKAFSPELQQAFERKRAAKLAGMLPAAPRTARWLMAAMLFLLFGAFVMLVLVRGRNRRHPEKL